MLFVKVKYISLEGLVLERLSQQRLGRAPS